VLKKRGKKGQQALISPAAYAPVERNRAKKKNGITKPENLSVEDVLADESEASMSPHACRLGGGRGGIKRKSNGLVGQHVGDMAATRGKIRA